MKNIVGQVPYNSDFYKREGVLKLLKRRLENNAHVYMTAPRRMGKTAIMRYLEGQPPENFCAVYVFTEPVDSSEQFFKRILEELYKSEVLKNSQRWSRATGEFFKRFKISLIDFSLEHDAQKKYSQELQALLRQLNDSAGDSKLLIMLDEFPQTVENIARKHGETEAINFLQLNRELRQQAGESILFLITGSIGLQTVVEKLKASKTVNDLNSLDIPPLSEQEARDLFGRLLTSAEVPYQDSDLVLILKKLEWFSPYHIQLLVQEFIDQYDLHGVMINEATIDKAFHTITDRNHGAYFSHYYQRLEQVFAADELAFALAVLGQLCQQTSLTLQDMQTLAQAQSLAKFDFVLRSLEFDGYIFKNQQNEWRFTSPLLKLWWAQYVNA